METTLCAPRKAFFDCRTVPQTLKCGEKGNRCESLSYNKDQYGDITLFSTNCKSYEMVFLVEVRLMH